MAAAGRRGIRQVLPASLRLPPIRLNERAPVPLVELWRGGLLESRHRGSVACVASDGRVAAAAGDAEALTFIRSAIKPFAAVAVVASGAADAHSLTADELAIVAGSHAGTDRDVATVRSLLDKAQCTEADLRNGTHDAPDDRATAAALAAQGDTATPAYQMCSGEHAGLLLLSRHCGWPTDGYHEREHPASQLVERVTTRVLGLDGEPAVALDDCALPTYAVPLRAIALGYARLANPAMAPADLDDLRGALERVAAAMTAAPERIGGRGLLDTHLMATTRGRIVAKEGAEGLIALGVRDAAVQGIAISIEDGDKSRRASTVAARAALLSLGAVDESEAARIEESEDWPPTSDSLDRTVADARAVFSLA